MTSSLVDPFFAGAYTIVTTWVSPAAIGISLPPPSSVNGGLCLGALTSAISGPVPELLIANDAVAVAPGAALKVSFFSFTEIFPPPGVGVAEGVTVAVGVAVIVTVAVGVAVIVTVAVAVNF